MKKNYFIAWVFISLLCAIMFSACAFEQDSPVITISVNPVTPTNVTVGSISGSLSVSANVTQGAALSYQWYSNSVNSNTNGTIINNATNASFFIPTTLAAGTYY